MASPVAHTLLGLATAQLHPRVDRSRLFCVWLWMVISANAADLDFIPGLLIGDLNRWHHGPSHSLLAVPVWAALSWFAGRWLLGQGGRFALLSGAAYATHLLADWLTTDSRAPYGIPLLWPNEMAFQSPVLVFGGIRHGVPGDPLESALQQIFSPHNFVAMGREMLLVMPVWLLAVWISRRVRGTR